MSAPWDGDLTGAVVDDRFVVGSLLGAGGMAEVYRAYDRSTTSSVAIKVFTGPGLPDDELRLQREATMLSSTECPGLIPVYASGTVARRPYFVMREITGGTLRQRMREPLPPRFVARIGGQIAAVLDHVHGIGVVHRDIKPSNILLDDEEKQAYLADFGLALVAEVTRVTTSGVLVGTAGYLAPEQVRGSDVGPPADVYSLGLVLLECLTGRGEYPGGDAEAALARLARPPRILRDDGHGPFAQAHGRAVRTVLGSGPRSEQGPPRAAPGCRRGRGSSCRSAPAAQEQAFGDHRGHRGGRHRRGGGGREPGWRRKRGSCG
jgi:serine/threonine protein kinase